MFENWFILALIPPALWALVVIIDDNLIRKVYTAPSVGVTITGLFSLVVLVPVFLLTKINLIPTPLLLISLASGFLFATSTWYYFKSLTMESPSIVIALWNLTYIIVPILAYFFVGEHLQIVQILGFLLVLVSSLFLSVPSFKGIKLNKVLSLMFISSIIYAVSTVMQKFVYDSVDFWNGYFFISIGVVLAGFVFAVTSHSSRKFINELGGKYKKFLPIFIATELINIFAILINNLAISKGPVTLVKIIEGTEPLYILFFALIFYKVFPQFLREATEGSKLKKVILMVIMLAGLYLINL